MKISHILILLVAILVFASSISALYAADVDVVRNFDNTTVYHTVKSDSGSQTVYGLENNAGLIGRDKVNHTEPVSNMKNTVVESDTGYYTYEYLSDESGNVLGPLDRVKFNVNRTLTANYVFTPYMFAEIDVIDLHGHAGSTSTFPAMKHSGDSITKTFKDFTDVEAGYSGLYILDLDTNVKYYPGSSFTINYDDVAVTGLNKLIKTFQYVYAKDIVIENIIVENRTIYNDTIVNRTIYNDTIVDRVIYNDTIVNRTIYNDTIVNRTIYNDTIVNRTIYNDTIVNRTIENITYVDKVIEIPKIIIDGIVNPIQNNESNTQNNTSNIDNIVNNNTSNVNTTSTNINQSNSTNTSILDNTKTITMKKTDNPIGLLLVVLLFVILIQLYRRD